MPKVIDVTAAIIEKNGRVLAARRKSGSHLAGFWEFPGGKLEEGETAKECLQREMAEEFGISVKIGRFVGESVYDYGSKTVRLLAFYVNHVAGRFQLIDHDELRWLSLEELSQIEWAPADIPLVEQYKALSSTSAYYENNAQTYCNETANFDMSELHRLFLANLSNGSHILDLGCGSGRDSKAFLAAGYKVTAVDFSAEVAAFAERVINQPVIVAPFQELTFNNDFEAVWVCASLLHCPQRQIENVLSLIARALVTNGVAYMSFKWGEEETYDKRGRYFNNYTNSSLAAVIHKVTSLTILDIWSDVKPLRDGEQKWVNALVKKVTNPL